MLATFTKTRTTTWTFVAALAALFVLTAPAATAVNLCPADIDGNGAVDSLDLNYLLGVYGTPDPAADFNRDGDVGCFDLEYLLGNWGPCPTCLGDVNEDGTVDTDDLNIVLATWGNDCSTDLDQDGNVDSDDVDAFLCLWGTRGPQGDFNSDKAVDSLDLNYLLANVGLDCRGDQNNDGAVDSLDLNIVLGNWGSC